LTHDHHIEDENLSLYAVRALSQNENGEVQHHLDSCVDCRGRLAEIIGGLSVAALTAPQEPRVYDARERIINKIKAEEETSSSFDNDIKIPETPTAEPVPAPAPSRSRFSGFAWIAAAIAIAAALSIGIKEHALQQQLAAQREQILQLSKHATRSQLAMDLLNSHSAERLNLTEARNVGHTIAHVIYDKDRAALIFIASNLAQIPANKSYQLWLIPESGMAPISLEVFRPDADGGANVVLPSLSTGIEAKTFDVSVEEAQGSSSPTMPFVLSSW